MAVRVRVIRVAMRPKSRLRAKQNIWLVSNERTLRMLTSMVEAPSKPTTLKTSA